jgi:predicted  nucleic acid-binding Zn-ribbon protein
MKYQALLLTSLAAITLTVGCDKPKTTTEEIDRVQEKTTAVAQDMKDYTFAQKAEFVSKMQAQVAALNQELDDLSAKVDKSSDAVKAEAQPKLKALREQTALLNKQLDTAKDATESTWDSFKGGFQTAYEATKSGFQQSRQWLSDKIAP